MPEFLISLIVCVTMFPFLSSAEDRKQVTWKEIDGVTVPVPPAVHPRLYLLGKDVPELEQRLQQPEIRKSYEQLKKLGIDRTPEEEAAETDHGFRYYFKMRGVTSRVQVQALDYLRTGNKRIARKAIVSMLDTLKRTDFGTKSDLSRASGVMLMCGAVVYDWCYDQMKPVEREQYIQEFVRIAGTMECGYPPKNTEPIAGHSSEWMVLRDLLSCGIAIYDEYPEMYNHVITMIYRDYVPVRNFIYSGHNYHQGTGYVNVRFSNDLFSQWILDRMGAGPLYDGSQQFVLYDFLYRRRPDGQVLPAGDFNPSRRSSRVSYPLPAMLASSYYKDEYLAAEWEADPKLESHCLLFDILWRDYGLKGRGPEDLPLTRYSGTPFGWMIARTGWGDESVIAEMKVNEHFIGNHQHMDGGAFQLYYKGPLAIDSGAYKGTSGGYNSPHNKNYAKRTIAHNSLLIHDPDEVFACWNYGGSDKTEFAANDGGQRMPGDRWDTCRSFESLMSEEYTVGQVLAHDFGPDPVVPDYSYLKGDLTDAYSSKVSEVSRSFVFLNLHDEVVPAALIVFDHIVAAQPSFRKTWLLHSIEEPEIQGNAAIIRRTLNGDSGMLRNDVILPAADNLKLDKTGGPGKDFWVDGVNYDNAPLASRPDEAMERGAWRVEVSPARPATEDLFLNVMQVADNGCEDFHAVVPVHSDKMAGVRIADRVVMFSKGPELLSGKISLDLSGKGNYRLLVTDLKAGTWQVKKDGRIICPGLDVHEGEHLLYLEVGPGHYEFCR